MSSHVEYTSTPAQEHAIENNIQIKPEKQLDMAVEEENCVSPECMNKDHFATMQADDKHPDDMDDGPSFTYENETDTTECHNSIYPCVDATCLRSVTGITPSTDPCTYGACLRSVTASTPVTDAKSGACSLPIPKKTGSKKLSVSSLSGNGPCDKTPTSKTSKPLVVIYDDEANEIDVDELTPEDAKELDNLARNKQYWMPSEHVRAPRRPAACDLATVLNDTVTIPVVDFATKVTVNKDIPVTEEFRLKSIAQKMARNALLFAQYPHLDFEAGTPHPSAYSGYENDISMYKSTRAKKSGSATADAVARSAYAESDHRKLRKSTKLPPSAKSQYQPSFLQVPVPDKSTRSNAAGPYEMTRDVTQFATKSPKIGGKRPVFDVYDGLRLSRPYDNPLPGSYQNFAESQRQLSMLHRDAEAGFYMPPNLDAPAPHRMTDHVIETFMNITGQSVPAAIQWLQMCNGDLHRALHFFYNDKRLG